MEEVKLYQAEIEVAGSEKAKTKTGKIYYKIHTTKNLVFNCYQERAEKAGLDMPGGKYTVMHTSQPKADGKGEYRWIESVCTTDTAVEGPTTAPSAPNSQNSGQGGAKPPEGQKPPEKRDIKDTQIARAVALKASLERYAVEIPKGEGLPTDGKEIIIQWAREFETYLDRG
jgi:hypothetical protein